MKKYTENHGMYDISLERTHNMGLCRLSEQRGHGFVSKSEAWSASMCALGDKTILTFFVI